MYVSILIRNLCCLINVSILIYLKYNYDCIVSCDTPRFPPVFVQLLRAWCFCTVVILSDLAPFVRPSVGRNAALLDAALMIQTAKLAVLTLSMMAVEGYFQYSCGQAICHRFPNMCVNGNIVIAYFAVLFHSVTLRICVGKLQRVLSSWAPDEYADETQTDDSSTANLTPGVEEQPGTSRDADPDREESTPEPDEQPGTSRETLTRRFPVKTMTD